MCDYYSEVEAMYAGFDEVHNDTNEPVLSSSPTEQMYDVFDAVRDGN